MKFWILLFFCFFFLSACNGDSNPDIEIALINKEDSVDYKTYSYVVQVEEEGGLCGAQDLAVIVEIYYNGYYQGKNEYKFREVDPGDTVYRSDTIDTPFRDASDEITFRPYLKDKGILFPNIDHCLSVNVFSESSPTL